MRQLGRSARTRLLIGASAAAILFTGGSAIAQNKPAIIIAPQPLAAALYEFGGKTGTQVIFPSGLAAAKQSNGVAGESDERLALTQLLTGTGLTFRREGDVFVIIQQEGGSSPQGASADEGAVEALIVTAQKREEAIQDVPIAISAFSQRSLEEQKIEGGFDLVKAIPNVSFSKSNFTSYNFSIRGVGTKAISATTDPGVAVAFNNTTLIVNRLFEQEYFDVERVEVLRGPQGTLYGRNATSGVINVITAKPNLGEFQGNVKLEAGNYDARRVVGMVNIPIVEDVLAIRLAGSYTQRTGYDYNEITQNNINGRDLWSGRMSVGFEPTPNFRANLLWEHFEEDDNRSRTGKQLCHTDPSPTMIGNTSTAPVYPGGIPSGVSPNVIAYNALAAPAVFSQGCQPGSLYDDAAFGAPNGLSLPYVAAPLFVHIGTTAFLIGTNPAGSQNYLTYFPIADPYGGLTQSRDLRTIASVRDPIYRAKSDVIDFSFDFDVTDDLTLTSQTVYAKDEVYSFQDFNRFNSIPFFNDTSLWFDASGGPSAFVNLAPRPAGTPVGTPGVFCDPQIGCTDRLAGFDISQSASTQFSQELRLQSGFTGPVNFSLGANYTRFETLNDYYVFHNAFTAIALTSPFYVPVGGVIDYTICANNTTPTPVPAGQGTCPYIDPNPIDTSQNFEGDGHNYFRSKNPYSLKSFAVFGELYWEMTDALKLTAGLRYTDDTKTFIPVPSQLLLARDPLFAGGYVTKGYPGKPPIVQEWGEWTGRLGVDWKPVLAFTDQTLLYAFYSRGYKGGGANPPVPGFATREDFPNSVPVLELTAVDYGQTFDPEFVNAFEIGAKNTLLDGALTFNATGFYYDYKDYQVSQIKDRTAVNENFDAKIWGLEFETVFAPTRNLRINANLGLLDTEIADGETSIDLMNRTQSDPNYTLVRAWLQLPSNCVLPTAVVEYWLGVSANGSTSVNLCGGIRGLVGGNGGPLDPNPAFGGGTQRYDYRNYPQLNGGAGIRDELGGNELPNAPHVTTNIGAQYSLDFADGWRATVRGDGYWQSQSWARVYNAVNDKLHGWYNANLSVWVEQPDWGLRVEVYAKNLLGDTPITDAFLNSDDSGLTTNVFTLDPRLVGVSVRKTF